jgi:hypothetical protein
MEAISVALASATAGLTVLAVTLGLKLNKTNTKLLNQQNEIEYLSKNNAIALMETVAPWEKKELPTKETEELSDLERLSYDFYKLLEKDRRVQDAATERMGYVYVLSSITWGNEFKIGKTTTTMKDRLKPYRTHNPKPVLVELLYSTNEPSILEREIQLLLKEYRVTTLDDSRGKSGEEFYALSLKEIEETFEYHLRHSRLKYKKLNVEEYPAF